MYRGHISTMNGAAQRGCWPVSAAGSRASWTPPCTPAGSPRFPGRAWSPGRSALGPEHPGSLRAQDYLL